MADRVLCGELLGGLSETRGVAHTVDGSVRWLHRALEGTPLHHALSRYLPDLEAPIGSRFDRYV